MLEGLSHSYVTKVIQDSENLIWIATEDGLNKFNGYNFVVFKADPKDMSTLPSNNVTGLVEDDKHDIWVGTWGGGVCIYDRKLDQFKRLVQHSSQDIGLYNKMKFVYSLFKDASGKIWICSSEGLMRIDPDTHQITYFRHDQNDPYSLSHNRVLSITQNEEGEFWIATYGGGLNHYDPQTEHFTHYQHKEDDPSSLGSDELYTVFYDSKHRLWVGSWNSGLDMMEEENGTFVHFTHKQGESNSVSNNQVWSIAETADGRIWVGTDVGLCLYNEEENNFYVYEKSVFDSKSLSSNSVKTIFADKAGRLWVGTYNGGVNLFDKSYVKIRHHYTVPQGASLSFNDVSAFLQINDSTLLVGTDGGGLNMFNLNNQQFTSYVHDPRNSYSIGGNKIKAILQDAKGRIWISFWGKGLDYFDLKKRTFTHYTKSAEPGEGPNSNNITSLAVDQEGMIWLGTFGGGVNRLDPELRTFEYFGHKEIATRNIDDIHIWSVLVDRQNNVWVGTGRGTLNKYDRQQDKFIAFDVLEGEESMHIIQSLFEDSRGNLWLAMEGGGLKLFDQEKQITTTYTVEDGLPSNSISAIEEDAHGNLWISSNSGISHFNPDTGEIYNYSLSEGLQDLQFNNSSSAFLSSGELMFGGSNGFNIFHPDSLTKTYTEVPLVFTNFQIFNKPVPIGGKNSPLSAQINQTQAITLNYDQSVISIEYAGLNYTDPGRTRYKYRLEGFVDESWQEVGEERKATYTNLDPGTYTFVVTTTHNPEGVEALQRSLTITITPPWWQTWWARVLMILLMLSTVFVIYKLRIRNIQKQNRILEKEVRERTIKLQHTNRALQQVNEALQDTNLQIQEQKEEIQTQAEELVESNEEIKSINQRLEESIEIRTADLRKSNQELDNFVYRVSHDIRAPLSSMLGLVGLMENEKNPQQLRIYLKMAAKSIHKLDGFVKDILDYSRNSRMEIDRQEISFPELLKCVREDLQYMENASRIEIIEEYQLSEVHYNDMRRLQIIFRNLLSNAIKYQNLWVHNSYLKIRIDTKDQIAQLTVEDNGIGINDSQLGKVFEMFYRGSDLSSGSGIGLYIVKETVEKLGGSIDLQSQPGVGTTIKINLPSIQNKMVPLADQQ